MTQNLKFEGGSFQSIFRSPVALAITAALITSSISAYTFLGSRSAQKQKAEVPLVEQEVKTVTALGRLEPKEKVIKLSAPSSTEGNRVEKLLVKEGDRVKVGQVVAILDSRDRLQAALQEAKEQVKVAQANLAQVKAGAKLGEIQAQKAEISRSKAQSLGDAQAQRETLARLEAQWEGDKSAQRATLARLQAQWEGDTAAQKATIRKLQAEVNNAQAEYQRYEKLYKEGAISQSQYDTKRLNVDTLTQQLQEGQVVLQRIDTTGKKQISEAQTNLARVTATGGKQINEARAVLTRIETTGTEQVSSAQATLNKIAEIRPTDITAAQAELDKAIASVKRAEANLAQAYVRSPQEGVIFEIHTRPGEIVSSNGIVDMGGTNQMYAVAEVYQSDISKVKPGQIVRLTSDSIPGELQGKVDRIGWQVKRQNIINADPSDNIDSRIIEVHIKLDAASTEKAAKFTNLQIKAVIEQ
ncbi:ABC exporter membrane fusion protein [Calothrix sp. 336/3]|uniref:ABC exporter membrane fusion protein n=1 Tax=Calothrix sp. 336/3 TaxID=1337936 RepID=UPI0004E414E4|nr:ABC exporter membrane fusion protein [Calothrix sp. 336/3]AKG24264.1 hemolysin D [Calothrix sp. 336/3]